MKTAAHMPTEKKIALPTAVLLWTVCGSGALIGAGWTLGAAIGKWPTDVQFAGLAGGAIVAMVGGLGVLIMKPWKTRPIGDWMTMWLAATVLRVFLTPTLTFLLYSSARLNAFTLTLSVASAYLVVLLAEAFVLARYVERNEQSAVSDQPSATT
jgi:hypothetical protein